MNLCWTAEQTKVVMTGVLNEATPTVIRRNLREVFPENKLPTAIQIANKIAHCRKQVNATRQVLATGDLRRLIAENSEIGHDYETLFLRGSLGDLLFHGCHFSLTFYVNGVWQ